MDADRVQGRRRKGAQRRGVSSLGPWERVEVAAGLAAV